MLRRILYTTLFTLLCVVALPVLASRRKTRPGVLARLGFPTVPLLPKGPRVWVHAASGGDVKNAWPVVRALKSSRPDAVIMLSVITDSGVTMAAQMQPPPDLVTMLPLDAPWCVDAALRRLKPDVLLLECTELWPTLMLHARAQGVRVALMNGRMGERSAQRYQRLFKWSGNPVHTLERLCLQTDADVARYVALGALPERCVTSGNAKFDAAARRPAQEKVEALRSVVGAGGPLLVAGSTHSGEEDVVLDAFQQAAAAVTGLRLLWAPRYLEHVDGVVAQVEKRHLSVAKRSAGAAACEGKDVILLDTMGELAAAYALGTVAVVGGSFVDRGGQNILEPAAQGIPVLHGPDMRMAPDQVAALDGHGAQQVSREELGAALVALLQDPARCAALGAEGRAVVESLSGAGERQARLLLPLLEGRAPLP